MTALSELSTREFYTVWQDRVGLLKRIYDHPDRFSFPPAVVDAIADWAHECTEESERRHLALLAAREAHDPTPATLADRIITTIHQETAS